MGTREKDYPFKVLLVCYEHLFLALSTKQITAKLDSEVTSRF